MSILNARTIRVGLCLCIASASASGTTYVVSSSGSGQFIDIQPAIDAAQPGDVLLVLNGSYGAFMLSKGLTIIGYGAPANTGVASILAVPAGETAVIMNVKPSHLSIGGCMGPVLAQDVLTLTHVDVQQCTDVRFRGLSVPAPGGPTVDACGVSLSRVEFARCALKGSHVPACLAFPPPDSGRGLTLDFSSRVQFALSDAIGGSGSLCFTPNLYGGSGAAGIYLGSGDTLFVTGGGQSQISGGEGGGDANQNGDCNNDGAGAAGILNQGGLLLYSGASIVGAGTYYGVHCIYFPGSGIAGGGAPAIPDDPTLDASGQLTAGGSALFTLRAPASSTAILYFGRRAIVVPTPGVDIEQLTPKSRIVNLGTIPASGQASFTWPIAASLGPGTLLIAQAEVTLSTGEVRRTNSVPVVLH